MLDEGKSIAADLFEQLAELAGARRESRCPAPGSNGCPPSGCRRSRAVHTDAAIHPRITVARDQG